MSLVERVAEAISKCVFCHGSGVTPEEHQPGLTEYLGCRDCRATGVGIPIETARLIARIVLEAQGFTCQTCGGKGRIYTEPNDPGYTCPDCRLGVVPSEAMIERATQGVLDRMDKHKHTEKEWRMAKQLARAALLEAFGGDE